MIDEILRFIRGLKSYLKQYRSLETEYPFAKLFKKFQDILAANNVSLELIADMGDKLSGEYVFDQQYILSTYDQLKNQIYRLIFDLNTLAPGKYVRLFDVFEEIHETIQLELSGKWVLPQGDAAMPYADLSQDMYELVGNKNANLADIGNVLELLTPDGFAITTSAYRAFMEKNGLDAYLQQAMAYWDPEDDTATEEIAVEIQNQFLSGGIPLEVSQQIQAAIDKLQEKNRKETLFFAVRSSAWGEDSIHSFAGQYKSVLNVPADQLLNSYRKVLASAYSPGVLSYRHQKGFHIHELAMSVGCQVMVKAKASGVIYTMDTLSAEKDVLLATAAWGLGAPVVEGKVATDHYRITRTPPHTLCGFNVVHKSTMMIAAKQSGTELTAVPEELQQKACLTPEMAQKLAQTALLIERYFKRPQDIEWAIDSEDRLLILQARPLNIQVQTECSKDSVEISTVDHPVLLNNQGIVVQRGVVAGTVFIVENQTDIITVPYGAILVAKHTSPRLARVIRKVHGILTDVGSPMGHMATIAREFRVPTIVNTGIATQILKTGDEITLDASQNMVYAGYAKDLCYDDITAEDVFEESYEYRLLRRVLRKISPLNLLDPYDKNFTPSGCKTVHDIIRFIHEKAVKELMHHGDTRTGHGDAASRRLKFNIPLGLIVIDIGGGVHSRTVSAKDISPEDITSVPMKAFLEGLMAPGMWSTEPMSVDFGSFMSSLTRTYSDSTLRFTGRNLAVVSSEYLDLNLRLGYHFNIIDAYIAEKQNDNYAYFRFLGGVTDVIRRSRRASFIGEVLERFNFRVEIRGDLVVGRIKKLDAAAMYEKVKMLGCLVAYTRQLDVQMHSDENITQHVTDFLQRSDTHDIGSENNRITSG
jgi:pyruvate, water dikinase